MLASLAVVVVVAAVAAALVVWGTHDAAPLAPPSPTTAASGSPAAPPVASAGVAAPAPPRELAPERVPVPANDGAGATRHVFDGDPRALGPYVPWAPGGTAGADAPSLEVAVVCDGVPVADARVTLWPETDIDSRWTRLLRSPLDFAYTDADGVARFPQRSPGRVVVEADHGGGARHRIVDVRAVGTTAVAFAFGAARLTGTAHDASGEPLLGQVVLALERGAPSQSDAPPFVAIVDGDGAFTLGGLPVATFELRIDGLAGASERRFVTTSLERDVHVRFGATPGARRWRGQLVDTVGAPVRGRVAIELVEAASGEVRRVSSASDGGIAVRLPPGTWQPRVVGSAPGEPLPAAAPIVVAATDVARDVVVPGHRVSCRLVAGTATARVRMAESTVALEQDGRRLVTEPPFQWNGSWWLQWIALPAGTCTLRSEPGGVGVVPALIDGRTLHLGDAPFVQLELKVH